MDFPETFEAIIEMLYNVAQDHFVEVVFGKGIGDLVQIMNYIRTYVVSQVEVYGPFNLPSARAGI
jgi:hypothetical protein